MDKSITSQKKRKQVVDPSDEFPTLKQLRNLIIEAILFDAKHIEKCRTKEEDSWTNNDYAADLAADCAFKDFKKLKTFEITPDNIYNFIARWHAAGSVLKLCEKCFTKKDTAYARFLVGLCEKVETLPDLIEIAAQKIKKQKATNTTPA